MKARIQTIMGLLSLAVFPTASLGQGASADLSRMIVIGDSLSAGFQNGSLMASQQVHGFAAVLEAQAGTGLFLPLIAEPGIPNALFLVDPGPPPVLDTLPGASTGRIDPTIQTLNLAVPGHDVQDALTTRPDFLFDDLTDLILGLPGLFGGISKSQVEWAEALQPTTVIIWLGNNDVLGAATEGDASLVTPTDDFKAAYAEVINRMAATGATLVVGNIPDVTVIPFLTSGEEVAALVGLPLDVIGPVLGIGPEDFVTPDAFEIIGLILGGFIPGPLPANVVLDAMEVVTIQAATEEFNAFIAEQASASGAALVDIAGLLGSLASDGYVAHGQRLTVDFLGGIFSLDGVHPTNTGYAIVANEFIHVLNTQFAAGVPPVAVAQVAMDDPLVLPGVGFPPGLFSSAFGMSGEMAHRVRTVLSGALPN